jgi:hypothetical protein
MTTYSLQAAPPAAKAAEAVAWVYAACFGLPAIPVAVATESPGERITLIAD